ncbi:MAG: GNAT family N-acetyltransferase [Acidobacteriota bacterium]|nr:GNAT family N-acetyltransferase [Acidobacteriota bacterium]
MKAGGTTVPILIRPAHGEDREWILPLSARLHDFGPPPWRRRPEMDAAVARAIGQVLDSPGKDTVVFVAEDPERIPLGFVHVHTARDFFTQEEHGHVSDIVVASGAEGRGVGRALMAAGEGWSRARGHRLLTLNVFAENTRARELYDRLGFAADTTKLVKVLVS